jgi:membrane protein involved in colicin uptake
MKNLVKKMGIYSMIGIMQIGFGASVIEASPLYKGSVSVQQQSDRHDRDQDRHERERVENERHEREMKRRPNEDERDWHERQQRENERHEENMRRIAHDILDLILDN